MLLKLRICGLGAALAALLMSATFIGPAHSHGGVSIADDSCILTIGPYLFHFTGYQPTLTQAQEFCEDIPNEGKAIVVLDHVDKALRKMLTDFRVIHDYKDLGNGAKIEQLDGVEILEKHTVFYKKPSLYPRGTVNVEADFKKGRYIGMVTVKNPTDNKVYTAIFPFSVGYGPGYLKYVGYLLALIVAMGAVYYLTIHQQEEA